MNKSLFSALLLIVFLPSILILPALLFEQLEAEAFGAGVLWAVIVCALTFVDYESNQRRG